MIFKGKVTLMRILEPDQRRILQGLRTALPTALKTWESEVRAAGSQCIDLITGKEGSPSKAVYLLKPDAFPKGRLQSIIKQCESFRKQIDTLPRLTKKDALPQLPVIYSDVSQIIARIYRSRSISKLTMGQARAHAKTLRVELFDEPTDYYVARPEVEDCHLRVTSAGSSVTVRGGQFAWAVCISKPGFPIPRFRKHCIAPKNFLERRRFTELPQIIGELNGTTLFAVGIGTDHFRRFVTDEKW